MKNILVHGMDVSKITVAYIISLIYKKIKKKESIYLIGERKDQCQDNGYHLFKYIRENHENDKIYYCITKDSNQLGKIEGLGNIIYYKSFKHYLYYFLAEKLLCAHVASCTPDISLIWKLESKGIINKRRVFLQHGITKELIPSLMYYNTNFESFICGAKPEYEYVKDNFGYNENSVKYLGLCRFDELHHFDIKNQILVMPTWRQWFGMDGVNELSDTDFIESQYFIKYNELINDKELDEVLNKNKMKLIFYPHNEMQRYIKHFKSCLKNVVIASKENYDVQTLLKESKILITDYSSIAFDFAYMKKPIIYYQFDEEEYFNKHYQKGYFNYKENGFGDIVRNINNLNIKVVEYLNCKIDKKYLSRINKFFELNDNRNCERNYYFIMENKDY